MKRIQVPFDEVRLRELETLMEMLFITNKAELINNALTLLNWVVKQKQMGNIIGSIDPDEGGYVELVMPFFDYIQPDVQVDVKTGEMPDWAKQILGALRQQVQPELELQVPIKPTNVQKKKVSSKQPSSKRTRPKQTTPKQASLEPV